MGVIDLCCCRWVSSRILVFKNSESTNIEFLSLALITKQERATAESAGQLKNIGQERFFFKINNQLTMGQLEDLTQNSSIPVLKA